MASLMRRLFGGSPSPSKGCQHDTITLHTRTTEYSSKVGAREVWLVGACHDCGFSNIRICLGQIVEKDDVIQHVQDIVLKAQGYHMAPREQDNRKGTKWTRVPEPPQRHE